MLRYLNVLIVILLSFLVTSCSLHTGAKELSETKKNVPDGWFRTYYSEGQLELEVNYENGLRISPIRHFYPSGQLHTEVDTDGNYHQYFEDGTLAMEFTEKNGKKIGEEKIYYSNGSLNSVLKYRDGECYWRDDYHRNGVIRSSCKILRGTKRERREICNSFDTLGRPIRVTADDGRYVEYHENGTVKKDFVYHGDTLAEEREYYPSALPKEIVKYADYYIGKSMRPAIATKVSFYENGKMKDSCYVERTSNFDPKTGRGLVHVCKTFYENGNPEKVPLYVDGVIQQKTEYYPTGIVKLRQKYALSDNHERPVEEVRFFTNGLVMDSCFTGPFGRQVCNRFTPESKPKILFSDINGMQRFLSYYDNGMLREYNLADTVGELNVVRYYESGTMKDSCWTMKVGNNRNKICNWYDEDGLPKTLRTVQKDTIYEKHFKKDTLIIDCKKVWMSRDDEENYCNFYKTRGGPFSETRIKKPNYEYVQRNQMDEQGKRTKFSEKTYRQNDKEIIVEYRNCDVENDSLINCKQNVDRAERRTME